jgi:hypothetical protein
MKFAPKTSLCHPDALTSSNCHPTGQAPVK